MRFTACKPTVRGRLVALAVTAALALPMVPVAALATPVDAGGTLDPAAPTAAGELAQEAADGVDLLASTTAPKYEYQAYYLDGFGDTWYVNGSAKRYLYIRTNNPDANFRLEADGRQAGMYQLRSGEFHDVDETGVSGGCLRVPGGYVAAFSFDSVSSGSKTLKLYEVEKNSYGGITKRTLAATFTATFVDYDQAVDDWIDDVISKYTTARMDPLEKMEAVSDGLRDEFIYPLNDGTYLLRLVTRPSSPYFASKQWDSYTSPAVLCLIAERIGGFSEIHNCYYDNYDWQNFHYLCRVTYQGEDRYYYACPSSSTGEMDRSSIKMVNFNSLSSSVFDTPRNFKQVEPQAEQEAEHRISAISYGGTVSIENGISTAVAGQEIKFTIKPDKGYWVSDVRVTAMGGLSVDVNKNGQTYSFIMPDNNVSIYVDYGKYGVTLSKSEEGGEVAIGVYTGYPIAPADVLISAYPDEGWKVESVIGTDESGNTFELTQVSDTDWTFIPESNTHVTVTFVRDVTYRVKVNRPGHSTIYYQDREYAPGDEVYYMIDPDEGYGVSSVKAVDGSGRTVALDGPVSYPDGLRYTFTMPESDVTITAAVTKDEAVHPISVEASHCSVLAPKEVKPGLEVNLHVSADEGYGLEEGALAVIDVNGDAVAVTDHGAGEFSFTMPDSPVTVKCIATFGYEAEKHNVLGLSADHGTVSVDRAQAEYGETVTVTLTPDEGYTVSGIAIQAADGSSLDVKSVGDNKLTFKMPNCDVTVAATFRNPEVPDYPVQFFEDVSDDAWYYEPVSWAVSNNVMHGYGETGLFGPEDTISRAQMASVLYNVANNPGVDSTIMDRFDDCVSGAWYKDAVSWAVQEGVFSGYDGGGFGPDDPIIREQVAVVLWRQAGEPPVESDLSQFKDGSKTSSWALEAMSWAVQEGIFSGNAQTGELMPTGNLTRAEAATVMMRLLS